MKNFKSIEESLIGINKAEYFGYSVYSGILLFVGSQLRFTCIIHRTVLRSCALSAETALKTLREKWKVPPSLSPSSPFRYKRFFSPSGEKWRTSRSSRQSVRCCQPLHFRATFAALFRLTKLQRDFHKAQRRTENNGDSRVARRAQRIKPEQRNGRETLLSASWKLTVWVISFFSRPRSWFSSRIAKIFETMINFIKFVYRYS